MAWVQATPREDEQATLNSFSKSDCTTADTTAGHTHETTCLISKTSGVRRSTTEGTGSTTIQQPALWSSTFGVPPGLTRAPPYAPCPCAEAPAEKAG